MNYFEREKTDEALINESIKKLVSNCGEILEKTKAGDYIRLHESTLGVEELQALNKAYLEGNITMGKYVSQYEIKVAENFSPNAKLKFRVLSQSASNRSIGSVRKTTKRG